MRVPHLATFPIGLQIVIGQWDPYHLAASQGGWDKLPSASTSLKYAADWAESRGMHSLTGRTQLIITPGYPPLLSTHGNSVVT